MPWIEQVHEDTEEGVQRRASPAREPLPVALSTEPLALGALVSLPSRPVPSEAQSSSRSTQEAGAATETNEAERQAGAAVQALEASEALEEALEEAQEEALEIAPEPPSEELVDIAAKLAEQLLRFHGCEAHVLDGQRHNSDAKHSTLNGFVAHHDVIPNTLSAPHMLAKGQVHPSDAEKWKHAFLGTTAEEVETPIKVCMQCSCAESPSNAIPAVTYDVDSIMGFARTLAVAKQGIRFNVTPHVIANLDSDVHLTVSIPTSAGRTRRVPLHMVPHYQFGRLVGYEDVTLYLFFPYLYERRKANNYLNQDTLRRWTDRVLLPAIYSQASAAILQHYPANYEHSKLSSKASHTEAHTRKDKSGVRHQYISHFLQPDVLQEVWDIILHTVEEDGFHDFRDVQIFFTAKNLKVLSKRPTLMQTWDDYFMRWEQALDKNYLDPDQVWIDIGKEVCAPPSLLWYQDPGTQPAETYLWRPCCLETYWRWSQHGSTPRSTLRNVYHTALLHDVAGMTILSARQSPSSEQGLVYSQFYTSEKEIFDAAKSFPFRDGALESLALDPKVRASWQKAGGSENHRQEVLEKSYLGSKSRCAAAIQGSLQKSFGTREEHRMTLTLALRVRECLQNSGDWEREVAIPVGLEPFWRVPTASYLQFVQTNINKFTTGFEYVRSLGSHDYVSWEHSQMMIMFLRLLKYSYGSGQIRREIALWNDERTHAGTGEKTYGLGFSRTVERYGYCWLMPKIDWTQFTFLEELPGRSLFGNIHIAESFTARWRAIREAKDDFVKVEMLGKWLKSYGAAPAVRKYILWHMRWMCVRHFRKDVLLSIESSIKAEFRSNAAQGRYTLCKENLDMILEDGSQAYRLASGNKMAYKDLDDFIDFLWDFDDGRRRKHWEGRGYRVLYKRCAKLIATWCDEEEAQWFCSTVKTVFPTVNWVIPYPNHTVFWQHTKQHQRMWLSVYHSQVQAESRGGQEIEWAQVVQAQVGQCWVIGRNQQQVLDGVPEDSKDAELDMEKVRESIVRKWQRYQG